MKRINEITAAHIGLIALIDEATGHQEFRHMDALRKMTMGKDKTEPKGTAWHKEQTKIIRKRIRETGDA